MKDKQQNTDGLVLYLSTLKNYDIYWS